MDNTIRNISRFAEVNTTQAVVKSDIADLEHHSKNIKQDQVNISQEAKSTLTKEVQDNINKALQKLTDKDATKTDSKTEEELLDEMIAELQEKLKELQLEMNQLRLNDDETSKAKLELLELEQVNLNAQLLELNNRKIEMLKGQ